METIKDLHLEATRN